MHEGDTPSELHIKKSLFHLGLFFHTDPFFNCYCHERYLKYNGIKKCFEVGMYHRYLLIIVSIFSFMTIFSSEEQDRHSFDRYHSPEKVGTRLKS